MLLLSHCWLYSIFEQKVFDSALSYPLHMLNLKLSVIYGHHLKTNFIIDKKLIQSKSAEHFSASFYYGAMCFWLVSRTDFYNHEKLYIKKKIYQQDSITWLTNYLLSKYRSVPTSWERQRKNENERSEKKRQV